MTLSQTISLACLDDLPAIIGLYAADSMGGHGDAWVSAHQAAYEQAFRAIERSSDNELYVVRAGDALLGTFQLTFIPALTNRGAMRCVLEAVQIGSGHRGKGLGGMVLAFAEARALARGASVITLTSNKVRLDAHRFYERHGYSRSHEGFKKRLAR